MDTVYEAVGPITQMIGKTMAEVTKVSDDELLFVATDGTRFRFYHSQNCCEHVSIESIVGDLSDLVGEPLLIAEGVESDKDPDGVVNEDEYRDSFTWTFYKFATRKGYVDVRWYGSSNGYYSESVDLDVETPDA